MTNQQKLDQALQFAFSQRPEVGGFPFLAECLRQAGVKKNVWSLPSAQSMYVMDGESLVQQGTPLVTGLVEVPKFNKESLIAALRTDQSGNSTFPEFLMASWQAGVVEYVVDFTLRTVIYRGVHGESYEESYDAVSVPQFLT